MLKIRISKIMSAVISCVMFMALFIPQNSMKTLAICCRKDGFDKSRYTLTGNMAEDVATIAKSQKGRFCDDFGYTGVDWGAWCDEFVADCIENAGGDSSIVAHGGTVADFANKMLQGGAVRVTTPQTGDLVFFTYSHVEIVTKVVNGVVYSAGGNNNDPNTNTYHNGGCCAGEHRTYNINYYLRPAYTSYVKPSYDPEGYLDTAEGGYGTVTLTGWALDRDTPNEACEIHIYMDGPSGQGGTCIATGIMADQASPDVASIIGVGGNHRFNVTLNLNVTGNHSFYAYAINRGGGDNNPQLNGFFSTYIYEKTNSVISNVYISSMTPSGYTVNIAVNDESKVGRIAVPVWTEHDGQTDPDAQDDLHPNWQWESIAKKNGANTYAFYVNTKDHNNECGRYCNDVYAYDESGKQIDRWCLETNHRTYADVPADKVITKVSPTMITHSGYKLNITVADDSRIDKIAVPVWTTNIAVDIGAYEPGQDDLLTGWQGRSIAKKTAKNHYEFDVSILDHNGEHGEYNNDIYAYDEEGNMIDRWCLETNQRTYVDVPAEKVIEDVIIENETPFGYDVIIKVVDESVIKNVSVPVWSTKSGQTDSEAQDDLIPNWESQCVAKKISTNTYSYRVNISDHNNESGEYCNDIYIYGNSGTLIERWSIETSHRTYAYVPKNIMGDINSDEDFNISDVVLLQKWLLAVPDTELANWQAADLCEDGRLDVFDLCLMKRMLVENS